MTDLIERARTEMDLRKRMHGDDRSNWSRADRMMEELLTALEAAREYVAEADRRVGEQFNKAQRSEAYALEKAAETLTLTKELEAAREDAERWRAVREMDGGATYAVLGDCDGMHPELADAAIDQARGKGVADEA